LLEDLPRRIPDGEDLRAALKDPSMRGWMLWPWVKPWRHGISSSRDRDFDDGSRSSLS